MMNYILLRLFAAAFSIALVSVLYPGSAAFADNCCGGSIWVKLDMQDSKVVTLGLADSCTVMQVNFEPQPGDSYTWYLCLCQVPTGGGRGDTCNLLIMHGEDDPGYTSKTDDGCIFVLDPPIQCYCGQTGCSHPGCQ
jgi:hypothetical protein